MSFDRTSTRPDTDPRLAHGRPRDHLRPEHRDRRDAPAAADMDAPASSEDGRRWRGWGSRSTTPEMPGMATEEQLDELADATGADADDLFVELMVAHHQGGIDMAEEAAGRRRERRRRALRLVVGTRTSRPRSSSSRLARRPRIRLTARTLSTNDLPSGAGCHHRRQRARARRDGRSGRELAAARRRRAGRDEPEAGRRGAPTTVDRSDHDRTGDRPRRRTTAPPSTARPTTGGVVGDGPPIGDVVDVGDAKPERFYDAYLAAALADIQAWWSRAVPAPVRRAVHAARGRHLRRLPGAHRRRSPAAACRRAHHATRRSSTTAPSTAPTATSWPTTTASTASSSSSPRRTARRSSPS